MVSGQKHDGVGQLAHAHCRVTLLSAVLFRPVFHCKHEEYKIFLNTDQSG